MSEVSAAVPNLTVFERVWQQNQHPLFRSEKHGLMAVADAFAKLPLQVVIAPRDGMFGQIAHFANLPKATRRKLHEVADAVGEKILQNCTPEQRVITHIEGHGVPDHAHIVMFAAERRQGQDLYVGQLVGELAIQRTIELLTFTPIETNLLEARLDDIY